MGDEHLEIAKSRISRRSLLIGAGGACLSIALASCVNRVDEAAPKSSAPSPPMPTTTAVTVPDEAIEINRRLRDAAEGDRVTLPAGTSTVRSTIRLQPGVSLVGHPSGSTVRLLDGTDAPFVLGSAVSNVEIAGIRFDGGAQSTDAVSIQLDGVSNVTVRNCQLIRMKHAVHVYAADGQRASQVSIISCTFESITDYAVRIDAEGEDIDITGNIVKSVAKGIAPGPAAFYVRGRRVRVHGNTVKDSSDTGVMVAGAYASSVSITDNDLRTQLVGIYYGNGARSGTLQNNIITSNQDFGIHVHDRGGDSADVHVVGNTIGPVGKSGVQVEGVRRVRIESNKIRDVAQRDGLPYYWRCGIAITALRNSDARSVAVRANSIRGDSTRMVYGVLLTEGTENVIVTDNIVSGASSAAYDVANGNAGPYLVRNVDGAVVAKRGTTEQW